MRRIAVTGCGGSAGYNFIESLRLAPEKFYIVGTDSSPYYAKLSNADKTYVVPPFTDDDYITALLASMDRCELDFIHPQPDTEVKVISDHRAEFKRTFLPSKETIAICQDKYQFARLMERNGIPVPKTRRVSLVNPVIKKSWVRACKGAGSLAALPVTDQDQMFMWIKYWEPKGLTMQDFIISDFLPGKEYAFQSVWKDGEIITSAARERIAYLFQARMPSGQSSTPTIAKSVHNDKVNDICTRAIKVLDPQASGVFCVDLKEDENGTPCITEINAGRFFTTSIFFALAGANMPYQYIKLAYGEEVTAPKYNAVEKDLYFIRQMDCGYKLVRENEL